MENHEAVQRNIIQKGIEVFTGDPVGDAFLMVSALSAIGGFEPLVIGAFTGGVYHLCKIYQMNRQFEEHIYRRSNGNVDKIHTLENPIKNKRIVGRYTAYLWNRAKRKVLKSQQ